VPVGGRGGGGGDDDDDGHGHGAFGPYNHGRSHSHDLGEDEYRPLHGNEAEMGTLHPGRHWGSSGGVDGQGYGADDRYDVPPYDEDSSYRGASGAGHHHVQPASALGHDGYQQSSAISPGYEEFRPR